MPKIKSYMKRSGAQVLEEVETARKTANGTNVMILPPVKPVDTGKAETVNGHPAEIFKWSGPNDLAKTLWVAKDYPDFDRLKVELAKIDRFNDTGPHPAAQPDESPLPGMIVQTLNEIKEHKLIVTLVSARIEPVDPSDFEIPADFSAWKPPTQTNAETLKN